MGTTTINLLTMTRIEDLNTGIAALTTTAIAALTGASNMIKKIDALTISSLTTAGGNVTAVATISGAACSIVTNLNVPSGGAFVIIDSANPLSLAGTGDILTLTAAANSTLSAVIGFKQIT